jgi:heme/copper-type cytochrome/quinol oxidase subunit 2
VNLSRPLLKLLSAGAALAVAAAPAAARACAACYGKSDSPLAEGVNWGILTLLVIVTAVLGGFVALFVHFARRAAAVAAQTEPKASGTL